jgi:hypothetical protein
LQSAKLPFELVQGRRSKGQTMQAHAILRLTLHDTDSDNRDSFWATYWNIAQSAPGGGEPGGIVRSSAGGSEEILRSNFGRAIKDLISLRDIEGARRRRGLFGFPADLKIHVRGINYGSIEILLAIIGGEELITEMFWSVLEFYAPKAFNDAMGATGVPMQAKLVHTAGPEKSGKLERLLTVSQTPLVAWVVLLIGVIYFGYLYLDKVQKENEQLNTKYNSLVLKVIDQNIAANSLISKIAPPQQSPPAPTAASNPASSPAVPAPTPTPTPTKSP